MAWLSEQTLESVHELRRLNAQFVHAALQQPVPAQTAVDSKSASQGGKPMHVAYREQCWEFSPKGRIVADGSGNSRLGWKTLAVGPFLVDGRLAVPGVDASERTKTYKDLLTTHREAWKGRRTYFSSSTLPDSQSCLKFLDSLGFSLWSAQVSQEIFYDACGFTPHSENQK